LTACKGLVVIHENTNEVEIMIYKANSVVPDQKISAFLNEKKIFFRDIFLKINLIIYSFKIQ